MVDSYTYIYYMSYNSTGKSELEWLVNVPVTDILQMWYLELP